MTQRIMIVEDERVVALDLKMSLQTLGYEVVGIASQAERAVRDADRLQPDLVLMDIHLDHGSDGTAAALAMRQRWRLPIVFLTAYADEATLSRAERSLPYGYLVKPFQLRELGATVRMALARRTIERQLENAEERLRLAIEVAALGVFEWETTTDDMMVAGHMERLLGGRPRCFSGGQDSFMHCIHEDDRAAVLEDLQRSHATSRTVRMHYANGKSGWGELHASEYATSSAGGQRLIGVLRDVTRRHLNDEKLRQAEVVFDSSVEGIVILDGAARIVTVNPAFTRMTGYPTEAVVGRDPADLQVARRRHEQASGDQPDDRADGWQGEVTYLKANGELFVAWQQHCTVRDAQGDVRHYVLILNDFSALRKAQGELNYLAYHDALTGLGNRRMLDECLQAEIALARSTGRQLALLFIDLDGFKLINDTLGHGEGDAQLRHVAARLRESVRQQDIVARFGGDEFVVLLPNLGAHDDIEAIADKILREIRRPTCVSGEDISISASIGIALFPAHGDDAASLIKASDSAMYEAKILGRNCALNFKPAMSMRARERLSIEQGLRRALDQNLLELHYQPVVQLADGALAGVEALLRWEDAELGPVSPQRFIPIAEEGALINRLGDWVIRTACRQIAAWQQAGLPVPRVAVNVSGRQFSQPDFVIKLKAALVDHAVPAGALAIEVTESVLQQMDASRQILTALRALDVQIAIDDFGAGFSALGLLKHLPIDVLKIAR
jgi:diguanylate cyclase (GGDEF)-like protein/PAS domain S-box-containing protein